MFRLVVALCLVGAAVCGPPVSRSRSEIEKFRDFLESSRKVNGGVTLQERQLANPKANVWENSGKYQGDILLDDEEVESLVEQFAQGRTAYVLPGTLWPNRTVVYEFAPGVFNDVQKNYILYTMEVLQNRTCIRFRPRNPGEFNYALITGDSVGCHASVGYLRIRGAHTMNLALDIPGRNCFNPIVIIHEWLHVIGFFHMQSSNNRNNYVRINWRNIERDMVHNFFRYLPHVVSDLGLPYEYDSCMHYNAFAFSFNGEPTIEALRPHTGEMGQADYVTRFDFWRVDLHYGCSLNRKAEDYQPYYKEQAEAEFAAFQAKQTVQKEAKKEQADN